MLPFQAWGASVSSYLSQHGLLCFPSQHNSVMFLKRERGKESGRDLGSYVERLGASSARNPLLLCSLHELKRRLASLSRAQPLNAFAIPNGRAQDDVHSVM